MNEEERQARSELDRLKDGWSRLRRKCRKDVSELIERYRELAEQGKVSPEEATNMIARFQNLLNQMEDD
jgi:hypothetical protein